MDDAITITLVQKKEIERLFASSAFMYPLYSVNECGWFDPELITDKKIREFWSKVKEHVKPDMEEGRAQSIATRLATEVNLYNGIMKWSHDDLHYSIDPAEIASEISRRNYLAQVSMKLPEISLATTRGDDAEAKNLIQELNDLELGGRSARKTVDDIADQFEKIIREGKRTVNCHVGTMDQALGGLERKTLTILAARPSMGKTTLSFQIAQNAASAGNKVVFFSLEESAESLWAKAACPLVGITWRDVLRGDISRDQKQKLLHESRKMAVRLGDNLIILDDRQTSETIWRTVSYERPDMVIIDHLRFVKDEAENENKRQGKICERLHDMAKAYDLPVLLLVQLNRGVESRGNKRPLLSDLRDSGEIEENADLVMMLYRDDYYNDEVMTGDINKTELIVRKFRKGPLNIQINLDFHMKQNWFTAHGEKFVYKNHTV